MTIFSKKLFSPEKQTEKDRLWHMYICGFVDGEGCFSISFRIEKKKKRVFGIEVTPSFSIAQKISPENYQLLEEFMKLFGKGGIRKDQTGCYKYEIRSLHALCTSVIPFFKTYPLKTSKANDFNIFAHICSCMEKKEHLSGKGLIKIMELSRSLNPSGRRRISLDILMQNVKMILQEKGERI